LRDFHPGAGAGANQVIFGIRRRYRIISDFRSRWRIRIRRRSDFR
jgi:hypothetical protein